MIICSSISAVVEEPLAHDQKVSGSSDGAPVSEDICTKLKVIYHESN